MVVMVHDHNHVCFLVDLLLHLFFFQGKPNVNTRKLVVQEGGFLYDSDSYADDLPYWNLEHGK